MSTKNGASILSTVAVSRGADNLAIFETSELGLTLANLNEVYNNYRLSDCFILMTISFFVFLILGLYLDYVLPTAHGLR